MLIKLLLIKMVASKVLGFSSSFRILFETGLSSPFKLSKSLGDSEKKATSEPDIRAERINKTSWFSSQYFFVDIKKELLHL